MTDQPGLEREVYVDPSLIGPDTEWVELLPWPPIDDREEDEYEPGGPLCACEVCEVLRERYGVEELTPDMIDESNLLQAVGARSAVDLDRLPPTVPPPVLDDVGGRPVVTPTLRPGLL